MTLRMSPLMTKALRPCTWRVRADAGATNQRIETDALYTDEHETSWNNSIIYSKVVLFIFLQKSTTWFDFTTYSFQPLIHKAADFRSTQGIFISKRLVTRTPPQVGLTFGVTNLKGVWSGFHATNMQMLHVWYIYLHLGNFMARCW